MKILAAIVLLILLGLVALAVRARSLEPGSDRVARPQQMPSRGDHPAEGGFTAVRDVPDPSDALRRLDEIAAASPRTRRSAGTIEEGHVVHVTRSQVFGFPDVTHIWTDGDRVAISGHLMMGKGDMGVNRNRILGWLSRAGL